MTIKDLKQGNYFYYKNRLYLKMGDLYCGDNLRTYNAIALNDHDGHGYIRSFEGHETVILAENIF
jgi:hypothetical protein